MSASNRIEITPGVRLGLTVDATPKIRTEDPPMTDTARRFSQEELRLEAKRLRQHALIVRGNRDPYERPDLIERQADMFDFAAALVEEVASLTAQVADTEQNVDAWVLVADGINHDIRCRNHFNAAGVETAPLCLRCRADVAEAALLQVREENKRLSDELTGQKIIIQEANIKHMSWESLTAELAQVREERDALLQRHVERDAVFASLIAERDEATGELEARREQVGRKQDEIVRLEQRLRSLEGAPAVFTLTEKEAKYVLGLYSEHHLDHACLRCTPHAMVDLFPNFVCIKHRLIEWLATRPAVVAEAPRG